MGKKLHKKDGHKNGNTQVEEYNAVNNESDVLHVSNGNVNDVPESSYRADDNNNNKRKEANNEKRADWIKKRKSEFDTDGKESQKVQKKHKKNKDVVAEVREILTETCLGGKGKMGQKGNEAMYLENNVGCQAKRAREDKSKSKNRDGTDAVATVTKTLEHCKMQETIEVQKTCSAKDVNKMGHGKEGKYQGQKNKKKKKQKLEKVSGNFAGHVAVMNTTDRNCIDKEDSAGNEVECRKLGDDVGEPEDGNRGKNKSKSVKNDSEGQHKKSDARNKKNVDTAYQSKNATAKERSKEVSFCDNVEVFPCVDLKDDAKKNGKKGLVYATRYSKEEDELVMNAVANYIESHNLGDDGLKMVLNCRDYPQLRNCWREIQAGIPWRPLLSVYRRAHMLFERDEKRPWTPEEYEIIHKFVEKHGPKWKLLADSLGKHRHHVKDTWRRIKLVNKQSGRWSQDEYQNLFDLVNMDLCMKVSEEKKSKHGMLRDNICWTALSDKMQSRAFADCCKKWYTSLASPMVAEGIWADADDYRMLDALTGLDACCMEDVDWDNLIEHRSGELCRKRWSQMVQHLGPDRNKSFNEQVEILANRYRPEMLDVREALDSRCPVDL